MYNMIKNFPTSQNAKMAYGILCALVARAAFNEGMRLTDTDMNGAMFAFAATAALLYSTLLCMLRFNTGRPLFETLPR